MADFSRLPYSNSQRDVNFDAANISEEILSQPFQNRNFDLKAGIHLHWALPDALCHGENVRDPGTGEITTVFAAVPNRWLITRSRRTEDGGKTIEAEWIVESDYLFPDGEGFHSGSISYPVTPDPAKKTYRPFRFMGRNIPLNRWEAGERHAEYLDHLTAVGYGQPAFAAFYPNCHSVFGFHDPGIFRTRTKEQPGGQSSEARARDLTGLTYDLLGWYADESKDYFRVFAEKNLARLTEQKTPADKLPGAFQEALKEAFGWVYDSGGESGIPSRILCYSRIEFQPGEDLTNPARAAGAIIAVGNTGTEALGALLSHQVDPANAVEVEDQLAAVQFAERLDHLTLDMGAKFQEVLHEKGFQAISGGTLWTIRPETAKNLKADAAAAHQRSRITLPVGMAHQLNTVNLLQQAYDEALANLHSMRRQLFSDWYKYMLCAYPPEGSADDYPDSDRVKQFIETADLAPLRQLEERAGRLIMRQDAAGGAITGAEAAASSPAALASQLAGAIQRLINQIDIHNQQEAARGGNVLYKLKGNAGPRYWQPREPAVLIHGDAARATERHGGSHAGGTLETRLLPAPEAKTVQGYILGNLSDLRKTIDDLAAASEKSEKPSAGFTTWRNQPWHPFMLSWEVDVRPMLNKSNPAPARKRREPLEGNGDDRSERAGYSPDFITANYQLPETTVDLQPREAAAAAPRGEAERENIYRGTTVLTPQAGMTLKGKLKEYLKKQMQASGFLKTAYPDRKIDDEFIESNLVELLEKYDQSEKAGNPAGAVSRFIKAYRLLQGPGFHVLSQSLGGFNEALLMHKQTLQLPVAEPLGFSEYRDFTAAVAAALGGNITSAPVPESDFNPIRSGEMELLRLQLIDTFGQVRDLIDAEKGFAGNQTFIARSLRVDTAVEENPRIGLPPRLAQPARVNFRWLSADLGEMEMNDHPATTPVCGWLLSNHLDNSLMIYDNGGRSLGSIDQLGRWQAAPGGDRPVYPIDIANEHLRKLAQYLLERDTAFQQAFISTIDSAMRTIEPANFAQHQARALLMGRPVALVRASVGLELRGLPAIHQAWDAFMRDMSRSHRHSDSFEAVRLPIRIGEYQQFNDGLVGYWVEEGNGYRGRTFYSPQSNESAHDLIRTHSGEPLNLYKSPREAPDTLLMLVDPRGAVHATSGLLPTKSIELPPDQISEALRGIEITFLSAPILSDADKLRLPLPNEPGYRWSWLERESDSWRETGTVGVIKRQAFAEAVGNGADIYAALVEKGWLKSIDADSATIVPKDQRPAGDPGKEISALLPAIEDIFDRAHITGISDRAGFSGRQALREGWLKLSQDDAGGETK
ncbi:MAG: hypothetical protein ACKVX9_15085 [Blastocatellia bacterium]